MGYFIWGLVAVAALGYAIWVKTTDAGRANWEAQKEKVEKRRSAKAADPKGKKLSQVGNQIAGGLACPKCNSTQFRVRSRNSVECVACRNRYKRG